MDALASIVLPVFALLGIGYLAAWTRLLPERAADGLAAYVFNLAVPLLVFRTIAAQPLPDVSPWGFWAAYFLGTAGAWLAVSAAARALLGAAPLRAGIAGCAGAYANVMLLGLPIILVAFGEEGAVPLFLLISVHLPLMMAASIAVGEAAGRSGLDLKRLAVDVARAVVTNPIILAICAAVAWKMTGLAAGAVAERVIGWIADTAVPCALVAMGLTLRRYGVAGDIRLTGLIVAGKLVLHPLLVFAAAWAFGLPPVWAGVAVLFAAAPSGVNTYVIAARYGEALGAVSGAILIGTGLALVSTGVVVSLLAPPL